MVDKTKIEKIIAAFKANESKNDENPLFWTDSHINGKLCSLKLITQEELKWFEDLVSEIIKIKGASKEELYSEKYVKDTLIYLFFEVINEKLNVDNLVTDLNQKFNGDSERYTVEGDVENLRILDEMEYDIIYAKVKQRKEEKSKLVIFTEVIAGEYEKAEEKAIHNFSCSFALMNLLQGMALPYLEGTSGTGTRKLIITRNGKPLTELKRIGIPHLNQSFLSKEFYDIFFENFKELKKQTTVSIEVKKALYFFFLGLSETEPSIKLNNFVTVLEILLMTEGDGRGEITMKLSERGAILLKDDFGEREAEKNLLKSLYKKRSLSLHEGELLSEPNLARDAEKCARNVILKLILECKNFDGNFEKFIEQLDQTKLRGDRLRTDAQQQHI